MEEVGHFLRAVGGVELDDEAECVGVVLRMDVAEVAGVLDRLHEPDGLEILFSCLVGLINASPIFSANSCSSAADLSLLDRIGLGVRGVLFGHHPLVERERPRRRGFAAAATARGGSEHDDRREQEDEALQDARSYDADARDSSARRRVRP